MQKKYLTLFGTALTLALASSVAVAQSPSGESTSAPSDIKMSPEGMEILCQNFPLNSRCGGGAAQAQPTSPEAAPETPAEGTSGRMNRRRTPEAVPPPGATDGPGTPAPVPPPGAIDAPGGTPAPVPAPAPGNMNIPPGTPVPGTAPSNMNPPGSPVPTPTPGATDSPSSPTEAPTPDSMTTPSSSDKPEASPSTDKKPGAGGDSASPTSPSPGKN